MGCIQGSNTSPTLFLTMFNDLIEKLETAGFTVLAFADDLSVIGIDEENLRKAIKICEDWSEENEM